MARLTKKALEDCARGALAQTNRLRQALVVDRGSNGVSVRGRTLNSARISKTFATALSGRENSDRFKTTLIEPEVSAAMSFVIDFSGSMSGGSGRSNWEHCVLASHTLAKVCDTLGVRREIYAFLFGDGVSAEGATCSFDYELVPLCTQGEKFRGPLLEWAYYLSPSTGTSVAGYADAAVRVVERMNARRKLAVFLTDGACSSIRTLPSLQEQARARGVELVGIIMGSGWGLSAEDFPNGFTASSAEELAKGIIGHIARLVEKG